MPQDVDFVFDFISPNTYLAQTQLEKNTGDVPFAVDPWRFPGRGFRPLAFSVPLLSWC